MSALSLGRWPSDEAPSYRALESLVQELRAAKSLHAKRDIQLPAAYFPRSSPLRGSSEQTSVLNGDDAAAIVDPTGYTLIAAEGMLPRFVRADPWFAGFCSVMVNVSDIAAMGGRATAIVDVLFAGEQGDNHRLLSGMRAASDAFGVPVVGGHTSRLPGDSLLAVAIVGRARRLISSFAARSGQRLLYAVDLNGAYRGQFNFNAATHTTSTRLRANLELLPELAEAGLLVAGKDVSMAGLMGTLAMLCESSRCGARVDLAAIPRPQGVVDARWLLSFPSFGYLLTVAPEDEARVCTAFSEQGVACAGIGSIEAGSQIHLQSENHSVVYWSVDEALTGYAPTDEDASRPALRPIPNPSERSSKPPGSVGHA